jgi:hypothetical protein
MKPLLKCAEEHKINIKAEEVTLLKQKKEREHPEPSRL